MEIYFSVESLLLFLLVVFIEVSFENMLATNSRSPCPAVLMLEGEETKKKQKKQ